MRLSQNIEQPLFISSSVGLSVFALLCFAAVTPRKAATKSFEHFAARRATVVSKQLSVLRIFAAMRFPLKVETIWLGSTAIELCVPDNALVKQAYQRGEIRFPYWSRVWPSAKALATFLLANPHLIAGKNLLELGAGLGLPSLVAARFAASVLCTDYNADAVAAISESASYLGLQNMNALVLDWEALPPSIKADVLLLSDVNYEPRAFALLQQLVRRFLQQQTTIVLSTPQRLMAKSFVDDLLPHCVQQAETSVQMETGVASISIFVLKMQQQ